MPESINLFDSSIRPFGLDRPMLTTAKYDAEKRRLSNCAHLEPCWFLSLAREPHANTISKDIELPGRGAALAGYCALDESMQSLVMSKWELTGTWRFARSD